MHNIEIPLTLDKSHFGMINITKAMPINLINNIDLSYHVIKLENSYSQLTIKLHFA